MPVALVPSSVEARTRLLESSSVQFSLLFQALKGHAPPGPKTTPDERKHPIRLSFAKSSNLNRPSATFAMLRGKTRRTTQRDLPKKTLMIQVNHTGSLPPLTQLSLVLQFSLLLTLVFTPYSINFRLQFSLVPTLVFTLYLGNFNTVTMVFKCCSLAFWCSGTARWPSPSSPQTFFFRPSVNQTRGPNRACTCGLPQSVAGRWHTALDRKHALLWTAATPKSPPPRFGFLSPPTVDQLRKTPAQLHPRHSTGRGSDSRKCLHLP